ncbi:uncharacterized protein PG986_001048 [Apiospora aurea]|uniref:DUF676 domain-containing protein n=1 Tax=Apiospora aurea TaxID=335848 RepID=A0ABR1QVR2_9PEZI
MSIHDWKRTSIDAPEGSANQYDPPPAYSSHLSRGDPRSNSTQSLVPSLPNYDEVSKRRLLVVYIHGFMGTDHSFQSFPAHVHRYLRDALIDSHVVHSKIYPRYKTYKAIEVARDNFSRWLQPHESPTTDVVLVGHSMGGLLAADVALMQSWDQNSPNFFQNRILGTVNLDAPLLGLHPGIIVAGLSSLFRSKTDTPKPGGGSTQGTSSVTSPEPSLNSDLASPTPTSPLSDPPTSVPDLPARMTMDPNFDPEFPNDVRLKDRSWWKNIVHFVKKHNSEGIIDAASHHIMSHLEFGSVLMDFNCLKIRYENLRKLEDIDDIKNHGFPHVPPQVRFVQYYTVCHGHPKKPKGSKEMDAADRKEIENAMSGGPSATSSTTSTPRASIGDIYDEGRKRPSMRGLPDIPKENAAGPSRDGDDQSVSSLEVMDPVPMEEDGRGNHTSREPTHLQSRQSTEERSPSSHGAVNSKSSAPQEGQSGDEAAKVTSQATGGVDADPEVDAAAKELSELELSLPKVPDPPEKPEPFDGTKYTDKDARKQAEKESKRVVKAYEQAVKNREKTIKERQKVIDKRKKKLASEAAKREKEAKKQASEAEKRGKEAEKEAKERRKKDEQAVHETEKRGGEAEREAKEQRQKNEEAIQILADGIEERQASLADTAAAVAPRPSAAAATEANVDRSIFQASTAEGEGSLSRVSSNESDSPKATKDQKKAAKPPKPKKERKFCTLPSKVKGQLDPKWIKVFMKDMDEVEAHTSLFFPGPHYDKLVGDMGDMIISWVQEDATKRAILEMG